MLAAIGTQDKIFFFKIEYIQLLHTFVVIAANFSINELIHGWLAQCGFRNIKFLVSTVYASFRESFSGFGYLVKVE